jgi:hypothetical protein
MESIKHESNFLLLLLRWLAMAGAARQPVDRMRMEVWNEWRRGET